MRWHYTTTNTCLQKTITIIIISFYDYLLGRMNWSVEPSPCPPFQHLNTSTKLLGHPSFSFEPIFIFHAWPKDQIFWSSWIITMWYSCKSHQILKLENDFPLFRQSQWYRDRTSILLMKDNCSTVLQEVPMRPSWKKLCLVQNTPCIGTSSTERAGSSMATSPPKISAWPEQHEN